MQLGPILNLISVIPGLNPPCKLKWVVQFNKSVPCALSILVLSLFNNSMLSEFTLICLSSKVSHCLCVFPLKLIFKLSILTLSISSYADCKMLCIRTYLLIFAGGVK